MSILSGFFDGGHDSIIGKIGGKGQKISDPLAWLPGGLGDKWVDLVSHKIPTMTNRLGSKVMKPIGQVDRRINPARQIPIVDKVSTAVENRPADAVGMAIGAYYAAPAMAGAIGGAAGGGASAAGGSALGSGAGAITAAPGATIGGSMIGNPATIGGMSGAWGGVAGGGAPAASGLDYQSFIRQLMQNQGGGQQQQAQQQPYAYGGDIIAERREQERQRQMLAQLLTQQGYVHGF